MPAPTRAPASWAAGPSRRTAAREPMSCWGRPTLWSTFCFATGLSTAFQRPPPLRPRGAGRLGPGHPPRSRGRLGVPARRFGRHVVRAGRLRPPLLHVRRGHRPVAAGLQGGLPAGHHPGRRGRAHHRRRARRADQPPGHDHAGKATLFRQHWRAVPASLGVACSRRAWACGPGSAGREAGAGADLTRAGSLDRGLAPPARMAGWLSALRVVRLRPLLPIRIAPGGGGRDAQRRRDEWVAPAPPRVASGGARSSPRRSGPVRRQSAPAAPMIRNRVMPVVGNTERVVGGERDHVRHDAGEEGLGEAAGGPVRRYLRTTCAAAIPENRKSRNRPRRRSRRSRSR